MTDNALQAQVREALRQISAHDLQILAEDVACIKHPDRFNKGTLVRNGRNDEGQTTKNWPDAFVLTGNNVVDGVEATRERQSWRRHLEEDLEKAKDPAHYDLSGYVFVAGYPDHSATSTEIVEWIDAFAAAGLQREAITILVGTDLVAELVKPQYAQVRQVLLGLPPSPQSFRLMGHAAITASQLGLFQPTQQEFEQGYVEAPALLAPILEELRQNKCCLVRGYGAAGKTTLAQLVCRSNFIAPNPSWYLNIGELADGSSAFNDMVRLAGCGVLFVIDNVHRDESLAQQLLENWRRLALPHGAKLLMLGRKISLQNNVHFFGVKQFELRAGESEMVSIVSRLYRRRGLLPPRLPQYALTAWARTFGGSADSTKIAVDLIAFTAAVDRQFDTLLRGDFRLEPADSIDAVRARYLQPLLDKQERFNLLRLASLAKFEIGLRDELLVDPIAAFSASINDLGIVIEDYTGMMNRRVYKLVHDALGELILRAAPDFESLKELTLVAGLNPAVGLRIISSRPLAEEAREIAGAIAESLRSGNWLQRTTNVSDVASVVRYAMSKGLIAAEALDSNLLENGTLKKIIDQSRSAHGVNVLVSWLLKYHLTRSLRDVGEVAQSRSSGFHSTILTSRPSDVAILVREHPDGSAILASLDGEAWSERQSFVPAETADLAVFAGRFFERAKRPELAIEPCRKVILAADPQLWNRADVSHLSHVLRLSQDSPEHISQLLDALISSRWLARAHAQGALGSLCGGLMSLSNYLPQELRSSVLTAELAARVTAELESDFQKQDPKWATRPICLLGAYSNLGGAILTTTIEWAPGALETLIGGLRPKNDIGILGMYELEFWLGLRALTVARRAPECVSRALGERFLAALSKSDPPTPTAAKTKQELEGWLRLCQVHSWRLVA